MKMERNKVYRNYAKRPSFPLKWCEQCKFKRATVLIKHPKGYKMWLCPKCYIYWKHVRKVIGNKDVIG